MTGLARDPGITSAQDAGSSPAVTPENPHDEGAADVADIYDAHSGLITDQLVDNPHLLDPISDQFAADNNDEYGQWVPPEGDDLPGGDDGSVSNISEHVGAADVDTAADSRALTDAEQANFNAINDILSGHSERSLVGSGGRGEYVHRDDAIHGVDDDDEDAPAASTAPLMPAKRPPWWQFKWFNWDRPLHRVGAVSSAALVVFGVVSVVMSSGDDSNTSTATTTTPPYTVPTITETSAAPSAPPGTTGADGFIPIKGDPEARCTAGSTRTGQAFDHNDDTAWMCVPASGVPGTVLRVQFDDWYLVTGVSIVPGWNRMNADNSDEWIKHMTAAVVEYQFNDKDETRFTQPTENHRGLVQTPIDPPILASAMTITIQEFGKPTGAVPNTTTLPGKGATIASDTPVTGDLKDFAISTIDIIGHRPN